MGLGLVASVLVPHAAYRAEAGAASSAFFHDMPQGGRVTSSSAAVGWIATHLQPKATATQKNGISELLKEGYQKGTGNSLVG
jgi:hypothetical protein